MIVSPALQCRILDVDKAATKRQWMTTVGGGDKQARLEADAGASAQDLDSPTDMGSTFVDDEMNTKMEVNVLEKRQAEQAAEANRRRQRDNLNLLAETC